MDFQSAIETFAEAWVAAYTQTPLTEAAETQGLEGMNREKGAEGAPPEPPSLRSPGSSSTALVEFRPLMKPPPPPPPGRAIPVHCIVEQVQGQSIELSVEDYAIIPSNTLFSELVRTALAKLGYSSPEALDAKGAIQLKNWKPLTFEQITESPEATVGDILYEVSTVATLRIRLYSRPKTHSANDVKEKLLQVLLAQSQNLLVSSGCPIDLNVLAALTKGRLECDIPDETRKKFDQWYLQQVFQHCRQVAMLQQQQQQQGPAAAPEGGPPGSPPEARGPRTRNRTSFDPELELPKLHRWFAENQHPSRLQIQQYVRELNSLESRRGRKPLDVNNVVYWFKNARAAHKRAEQKCCANGGAAPPLASSDDSDNMHTLDLSVRRGGGADDCPDCVVKEEPRDSSCSEHSLESSDSGDELEVNVMDTSGGAGVPRGGAPSQNGLLEERRKRNRTFIDPVSEVPRLEQWFSANTHPSQGQIVRFTNELNGMQYRQKFPKLEPKNIQFWFKNRRAKCKRLNLAANLSDKMLLPDKLLLPAAAN